MNDCLPIPPNETVLAVKPLVPAHCRSTTTVFGQHFHFHFIISHQSASLFRGIPHCFLCNIQLETVLARPSYSTISIILSTYSTSGFPHRGVSSIDWLIVCYIIKTLNIIHISSYLFCTFVLLLFFIVQSVSLLTLSNPSYRTWDADHLNHLLQK